MTSSNVNALINKMVNKVSYQSAVVIEQHPLLQNHIKRSLQNIGFSKVHTADRASSGLKLLAGGIYDLVVCSSDLDRGADGYQFFEQIKVQGYLRNQTTFVYLSSDDELNEMQSVIELQPDEYILKPFNAKKFESKVVKAVDNKLAVKSVLVAVDQLDYPSAIKRLNQYLLKHPDQKLNPYLLKLKGDIIFALKNWPVGEKFFHNVLKVGPFPWAHIGYLECLIHQGKHNNAKHILEKLVESPATRVKALEMLAMLEEEHKDYDTALKHLKQASQLSIRNVNRWQHIAELARNTHDFEVEYEANSSVVRHARHSIHDVPQIYLSAARSAADLGMASISEEDTHRLAATGESFLGLLKQNFPTSGLAEQINVTQARLYNVKSDHKMAKQLMNHAMEHFERLLKNINPDNVESSLDLAKALHEMGLFQQSAQIFEKLIKVTANRHNLLSDYLSSERKLRLEVKDTPKNLNNKAVDYFKVGNISDALKSFELAFKVMPKNPTIALNLLQTVIESHHFTNDEKVNFLIRRCQKSIDTSSLTSAQKARYDKLKEMLNQRNN